MRAVKLLLSIVIGLLLAAGPAHAQHVIDQGHVDAFYVVNNGGQLQLGLKDDATGRGIMRRGDDVILGVKADARTDATKQVPGIEAETYYLPQVQNPNLLWPGWDTQQAGGPVDFHFTIQGPGNIYVFEEQGRTFSPVTTNGSLQLASGSVIKQEFPAHRHVSWAFTHPGTYYMTVQATSNGLTSNAVRYTWQVGQAGHTEQQPGQPAQAHSSHAGSSHEQAEAGQQEQPEAEQQQCVPAILPKVKNDTVNPPEWIDANDATFHLGDAAQETLPQDIGKVSAGQVWMIASVQKQGVPWLGANTQHPTMTGEVTWTLTGFEGPGSMVVYEQGGLGQIVGKQWFSADSAGFEGSHTIAANTHVHPNWVFSAPGTYKVTIAQQEGEAQGEATVTFVVGGAPEEHMFTNGHFDLGGEVTCGAAAQHVVDAPAPAPAAPAPTASGQLANTGSSMITFSMAILGLGLAVLGAALVNYARAQN